MSQMQSRSERAERLLAGVETSPGSGDFRVDERLCVEDVWQRCDQAISMAKISVRIDDAFDAEEARRRYHPDCRIVVMTDETDVTKREILFEGYPPVQSTRWDGRIDREEERYVFEAEHVFERLSRDREAWVYGRHVRNGEIEDGLVSDPQVYADKSVLMTALPCMFNPDGVANRAVAPLTVRAPSGESRFVHLFTWDDAQATRWTYGTALRYLVWFYQCKEGPVFEGNIFSATDLLAADLPGPSDPLGDALRREPVSLNCEATNLVEALSLLAAAAGVHITAETINVGGSSVTQLRVWVCGGGPQRHLYLVRGGRKADGSARYDTSTRSISQIMSDNNTYRGQVSWDHGDIVNCPVVIGDVKRYEMTLPLWPGWCPRVNLDSVASEDRAAAKALALTPDVVEMLGGAAESYTWFQYYHRRGSLFKNNTDVSRLWVLNEDGRYGSVYNRNTPFDDYQPFDFSTVLDSSVSRRGAWMRRVRRLLPTISTVVDGQSFGVWVEISFDSGTTWQQQSNSIRILENRAGIYIDCENPTEITPADVDSEEQNLWYAIIDQTFRVRVTAVIESDERLMATFPPESLASPTLQVNAMVVRRPQSFQYASRLHATSVLSSVGDGELERDDSNAISALAEQLAGVNQDRQVRVLPVIPWIETDYALGDQITEIRGRQLRFATTRGAERRWPAVLERRFRLNDGRYETSLTLGITEMPAGAV